MVDSLCAVGPEGAMDDIARKSVTLTGIHDKIIQYPGLTCPYLILSEEGRFSDPLPQQIDFIGKNYSRCPKTQYNPRFQSAQHQTLI
jgi:hypothetical protein